jgi:hypothetical protein
VNPLKPLKEERKITLGSFRGGGGGGDALGGVHGGRAATIFSLVLLVPILHHGCAACSLFSSALLGFPGDLVVWHWGSSVRKSETCGSKSSAVAEAHSTVNLDHHGTSDREQRDEIDSYST